MERGFKGIWIPREIWETKELTIQEKIILLEIDSLDNEKGCFASNQYFADFFDLSTRRITEILSSLVKKGYITHEQIREKGNVKTTVRILKINRPPFPESNGTNLPHPLEVYSNKAVEETFQQNNTLNNNTLDIDIIIKHWNELEPYGISKVSKMAKTSKRYKSLMARYKEYGYDEMIKAIESIKVSDYLQGKVNGWKITFDWFVCPNNFPKVLDGNYINHSNGEFSGSLKSDNGRKKTNDFFGSLDNA